MSATDALILAQDRDSWRAVAMASGLGVHDDDDDVSILPISIRPTLLVKVIRTFLSTKLTGMQGQLVRNFISVIMPKNAPQKVS